MVASGRGIDTPSAVQDVPRSPWRAEADSARGTGERRCRAQKSPWGALFICKSRSCSCPAKSMFCLYFASRFPHAEACFEPRLSSFSRDILVASTMHHSRTTARGPSRRCSRDPDRDGTEPCQWATCIHCSWHRKLRASIDRMDQDERTRGIGRRDGSADGQPEHQRKR